MLTDILDKVSSSTQENPRLQMSYQNNISGGNYAGYSPLVRYKYAANKFSNIHSGILCYSDIEAALCNR